MIASFESTDSLLNNVFNTSLNGIVVMEAVRNVEQEVVDFRYIIIANSTPGEGATFRVILPI